MAEIQYWIADAGGSFDTSPAVLRTGQGGMLLYDYKARAWGDLPPSWNPYGVSPEVEKVTEAQARQRIKRHGGTWVEPGAEKASE